jgi:hypothetical protein
LPLPEVARFCRRRIKKAPENQGLSGYFLPAVALACQTGNHSHSKVNKSAMSLILLVILSDEFVSTIKNTSIKSRPMRAPFCRKLPARLEFYFITPMIFMIFVENRALVKRRHVALPKFEFDGVLRISLWNLGEI